MEVTNITNARKNLFELVKRTNQTSEPIIITGKTDNAVLVSLNDWNAIQETIFLHSIPGMVDSIREGLAEPESELTDADGVEWDV